MALTGMGRELECEVESNTKAVAGKINSNGVICCSDLEAKIMSNRLKHFHPTCSHEIEKSNGMSVLKKKILTIN